MQLRKHIAMASLKLKPNKCHLCGERFKGEISKSDHIRRHHTKEKPHKCSYANCDWEFVSLTRLNSHQKTHLPLHQRQKFPCPFADCKKRFTAKPTVKVHILREHSSIRYNCKYQGCKKSFGRTEDVRKHEIKHSDQCPSFTCTFPGCDKKFTEKGSMKYHLRILHKQSAFRPFACNKCPNRFESKWQLEKHVKTHENLNFECKLCSKTFSFRSSLFRHRKNQHSGGSYQCSICDKVFTSGRNLSEHVKSKHGENGKQWFFCYFCRANYETKYGRFVHLLSHTRERVIQCKICPKKFYTETFRNRHMKLVHNDVLQNMERICRKCGKSFASVIFFRRHVELVHKRPENTECFFCKKILSSSSAVRKHLISKHTKERPFFCKLCEFTASNTDIIRAHKLKHK